MATAEKVMIRGGRPSVAVAKNKKLYVQVPAGALDAYIGRVIEVSGFNCAPRAARILSAGAAFVVSHSVMRECEDANDEGLVATGKTVSLSEQRYYLVWA